MKSRQLLATIILIPFLALTAYALADVGYIGLFEYQLNNPAGWQVLADLVIALILLLTWLIPEAKKQGRNPWPWVGMTFFVGSISPLLFLAFSKSK